MVIMIILVSKLTTNLKVEVDSTLPEFNVTKNMTWNFDVENYAKIRYDMILVEDPLT